MPAKPEEIFTSEVLPYQAYHPDQKCFPTFAAASGEQVCEGHESVCIDEAPSIYDSLESMETRAAMCNQKTRCQWEFECHTVIAECKHDQ
jgi:hypothetical protein